jgi:type IV pilus assembly protein PilW
MQILNKMTNNGFTLIEIMIAMALSGIVSAMIYKTYISQQKTYIAQKQIANIQQNLRSCTYLLEEEIKRTGFNPRGCANPSILIADKSQFQFQADINENGNDFTKNPIPPNPAASGIDPNEQIRYSLNNDKDKNGIADKFPCALGRSTWNGGLMPMADNIEVLNFVYLDENGGVLEPLPLNPTLLSKIKSVEITIIARSQLPDRRHIDTGLTDPDGGERKGYFNLQGDLILNQPDDNYYRRCVSKIIRFRNI